MRQHQAKYIHMRGRPKGKKRWKVAKNLREVCVGSIRPLDGFGFYSEGESIK